MATRASSNSNDAVLTGPTPQRFAVAEGQLAEIAKTAAVTVLRLGSGALVDGYRIGLEKTVAENEGDYAVAKIGAWQTVEGTNTLSRFAKPREPLILYDMQDCGECKRVREALSILDLDALVYPCPVGGPEWSGMGTRSGPVMVDPSSGVTVTGSDIVEYLFVTYGNPNKIPMMLKSNSISDLTLRLAMSLRKGKGTTFSGAAAATPQKPLVFWAYEASPFCAVVREVLSELALPYVLVNCARGSPKRNALFSKYGHFQAPCLVDDNAGVAMFESAAIIDYLKRTYQ
ncbi:hypothetical protein M9435_005084 [Picochlorum sp. BPE23]|nr:hypothetical protein M9435_005084 [Picochlorum sp. BPE23]